MFDDQTWEVIRKWNSFAPWLSGIGSLSAVVVTLWLLRREKFVRLLVETGYGTTFFGNPAVIVTVTNIGVRKATIKDIYIKAGAFRPVADVLLPDQLQSSPKLPESLDDGEFTQISVEMEATAIQLKQLFRNASWWNGGMAQSIFLRTVKLGIRTSTGKTFEARLNHDGVEQFLKYFRLADQKI